mgnify:CR=1 FL=1
MWYLIYSEDVAGSLPQRKLARPAHLARLQALQDEGRLLTAGPNPAIDAEDPSHNDSNQVLDDTVGMVDTHLTKAKSGLVCSPRGPSIGKDDTRGGSEVAPVGLGCFESETEKARSEMT